MSTTVRPGAVAGSEKAAVTRIVSLPSWSSVAAPVAMRRPLRASSVRTSAGPGAAGRRKNADTAIACGAGITGASA